MIWQNMQTGPSSKSSNDLSASTGEGGLFEFGKALKTKSMKILKIDQIRSEDQRKTCCSDILWLTFDFMVLNCVKSICMLF